MVERELEPYQREGGPQITIKGPDVLLPPQCTSILAMTLHELATNAVKYGALSRSAGQLGVTWRTARGGTGCCSPGRSAAPPFRSKRNNGFGMQLIDKGIRHNLGGETKVDFRATGLYVELNVPLEPSSEPQAEALAGARRARLTAIPACGSPRWRGAAARRSRASNWRGWSIMMLGCSAASSCSCSTASP